MTATIATTRTKAMLAKLFAAGMIAGAFAIAAPAAHAQVALGVRVGPVAAGFGPVYGRPVPPVPVYGYGGYRLSFGEREAIARREAWDRHEFYDHREFDRDHDHGYDHRFDHR